MRVENMVAGDKLDLSFWHPLFMLPRSRAYAGKKCSFVATSKPNALKFMENQTRLKRLVKMIKGEVERLGQIETTRALAAERAGFSFERESES